MADLILWVRMWRTQDDVSTLLGLVGRILLASFVSRKVTRKSEFDHQPAYRILCLVFVIGQRDAVSSPAVMCVVNITGPGSRRFVMPMMHMPNSAAVPSS